MRSVTKTLNIQFVTGRQHRIHPVRGGCARMSHRFDLVCLSIQSEVVEHARPGRRWHLKVTNLILGRRGASVRRARRSRSSAWVGRSRGIESFKRECSSLHCEVVLVDPTRRDSSVSDRDGARGMLTSPCLRHPYPIYNFTPVLSVYSAVPDLITSHISNLLRILRLSGLHHRARLPATPANRLTSARCSQTSPSVLPPRPVKTSCDRRMTFSPTSAKSTAHHGRLEASADYIPLDTS